MRFLVPNCTDVSDVEADRGRLLVRLGDVEAQLAVQSRENDNLLLKLERARVVREPCPPCCALCPTLRGCGASLCSTRRERASAAWRP